MTRSWRWAAASLAVAWFLAWVGIRWAESQRETAESLAAFANSQNLHDLTGKERAAYLDELIRRVNRLEFDERQRMRQGRGLRDVVSAMTDEERIAFLDGTLPKGFAQLMDSLNRMDAEKRQKLVRQALEDMERRQKEMGETERVRAKEMLDDASFQRVVQHGFESFLKDANAETKLDLAPLLEQMQRNLRGMRQ